MVYHINVISNMLSDITNWLAMPSVFSYLLKAEHFRPGNLYTSVPVRHELTPTPFDTDLKSLEAIATGGADAYVGNLTHASYLIERRGLSNLKVAAPSLFGDHVFSFGSRKDWPELSSIINKGLDSITPEEKTAIRSKHIKLIYEHGIKPGDIFKWILIVAGSALLILILFMLWNKNLAKQVRVRTSELTTSNKLLETEIEERKQVEESLQQSKNFNQSTLDSLQYHIAVKPF